jgi:hypothetical protein
MAWFFLHVCAVAANRGGFSSRHTELLYFGILSTLFGCAVLHQRFHHKLLNRLLCLWFWLILAGILFQMGLGWRQLGGWKDFWLERYESVYAYLISGDRDVIADKTFERDKIVSTWLASNPEVLRSPELVNALPSLPINRLWVEPEIDAGVNRAAIANLPPPHAFLLWQRVDGPRRQVMALQSPNQPFIKLNIYGVLDFDLFNVFEEANRRPLSTRLTLAFGQPPGWRTIFLRTPAPGTLLRLEVKPKPHAWVLVQAPTACSWVQYVLEKIGRKAEFLALLGAFSVFLILSAAVKFQSNPPTNAAFP